MTIAIAMTTCPRAQSTIEQSLASLHAAGFTQSVEVSEDPEKAGALQNWVKALTGLVERTSDPFLMVVQDDTTWALGSRQALERELVMLGERAEMAGLLSPFLVNKIGREIEPFGRATGWYPSNLGYRSGGALAYILPRPAAVRLLQDDGFAALCRERRQNIDRWVPGRLLEMGYETLYRYPSLVNHRLGSGNSSIKVKKPHDTMHWRPVA